MRRCAVTIRWAVGCAMILAGFCGIASAEDTTGRWGLDGMIGGVMPVGPEFSSGEEVDYEGYAAGAGLRYGLARSWGLEAAYEDLRFREGIQLQPITLSLLYYFNPEDRLTPYVSIGGGYAAIMDNYNFDRVVGRAGIGLEYFFSSAVSGRIGGAYHVTDKTYEGDVFLQSVTGTAHLTWWWGAKGKEAVKEAVREVVLPPAPVDSDGDGVTDEKDLCPNTPMGTPVDATGCPLPVDSDGDGVTDDKDLCPGTPMGTAVDATGCPIVAVPEPIVEVPPVKEEIAETAESVTLEILFDSGKTTIKAESIPELARVAYFLKKYPAKQALIEGHTDSVGSEQINLNLSQKRADSVRQYMIEKLGVDSAQVKAKGFGESKPIGDNTTAEGRAQNRRVVASFSDRAVE